MKFKNPMLIVSLSFLVVVASLHAQLDVSPTANRGVQEVFSPLMMLGNKGRVLDNEETDNRSFEKTRAGVNQDGRSLFSDRGSLSVRRGAGLMSDRHLENQVVVDSSDNPNTISSFNRTVAMHQSMLKAEGCLASFKDDAEQGKYFKTKASIEALCEEALRIEETANESCNQAVQASPADQSLFYEQAIQNRLQARGLWSQAIECSEHILAEIPLSYPELRTEWNIHIYNITVARDKASLLIFWDAALKEEQLADLAFYQWTQNPIVQRVDLCEQAREQNKTAIKVWQRALQELRNFNTIVVDEHDWNLCFTTAQESINDAIRNHVATILVCDAMKSDCEAWTREVPSLHLSTQEELLASRERAQKSEQAMAAWKKTSDFFNNIFCSIPKSRPELKQVWQSKLELVSNAKNMSIAAVFFDAAQREDHLAGVAWDVAINHLNNPTCYEEAFKQSYVAQAAWDRACHKVEKAFEVASADQKAWWGTKVEDMAHARNNSSLGMFASNAERAGAWARSNYFLGDIEARFLAAHLWTETLQFLEQSIAITPLYREDLRSLWMSKREAVQLKRSEFY